MRMTRMPAATHAASGSASSEAGPIVATICRFAPRVTHDVTMPNTPKPSHIIKPTHPLHHRISEPIATVRVHV